MYFFADDISPYHEKDIKHPDTFCYGGYLIRQEHLKPLERRLEAIKDKYNIPASLPVKFNFRDGPLERMYDKYDKKDLLDEIKQKSYAIRRDILSAVIDFDIKIIFSGFRELRTDANSKDFLSWSFTKILQRIPFESIKENKTFNCVLDWDEKNRDVFTGAYHSPYYKEIGLEGETFYPDAISGIKKCQPYITFSVTVYNPFLQIADIIVGTCGSFLEYCFKDKKHKNLVEGLFPIIAPYIRGFDKGDVFSWGLLIEPSADRQIVKNVFAEILNKEI